MSAVNRLLMELCEWCVFNACLDEAASVVAEMVTKVVKKVVCD